MRFLSHKNSRQYSFAGKQSGVALITAVTIVAMASIAAVAMTQTLQLSIHRTTNVLMADQRYLYTLGGEAWSRGQLIRDGNDYDGLDEDWAKELPLTMVEGGQVMAKTSDLQARFNLNNLYQPTDAAQDIKQRTKQQIVIFQRLLSLLELDEAIALATSDWLDQDSNPQFPDGAEDNEYLGLMPPRRTANSMMASPTELMLVRGVTSEVYEKLEPHITVLPEFTQINVNTTSAEIFQALFNLLDDSSAESLVSAQKDSPFTKKTAFLDRLKELLGDNKIISEEVDPLITVSSHYFLMETTVRMDNASQTLRSLLHRHDRGVSTLSRTLGLY